MRRNSALVTLSLLFLCACGTSSNLDLITLQKLQSKGRFQDSSSDPVVQSILNQGSDAIPFLISRLDSVRPYAKSPIDYWPDAVEGDVALSVLSDLFLDPTWTKSTLPHLCWGQILGRTNNDLSARKLMQQYLVNHSRSDIRATWQSTWNYIRRDVVWDESGKFFRLAGRELNDCL